MVSEKIAKKVKQAVGWAVFTAISILFMLIGGYAGIVLALPAFLTSLYMIFVMPGSGSSSMAKIITSYALVAAGGIMLYHNPVFAVENRIFGKLMDIMLLTGSSTLLLTITGLEHPPVVALPFFFITAEELGIKQYAGMGISILLLIFITIFMKRLKDRTGGKSDEGMPNSFNSPS